MRVVVEIVTLMSLFTCSENELTRRDVQDFLILDQWHQLYIVLGVSNHHTSKKILAIESEQILLINILERIFVSQSLDWRRRWSICELCKIILGLLLRFGSPGWHVFRSISVSKEVPKTCNLNPQKLQLGAQIWSLELPVSMYFCLC